jgi:hypothetical protein
MLHGIRISLLVGTLAVASLAYAEDPSLLRVREDPQRDRLWVLRTNGVHLYSLKTRQLLRHVPLPGWYWAGEPYSCAPDLAIGPRGEALVTSDIAPVLWRIDPRSLTVTIRQLWLEADTHMDIGFTGLAYSARHGAYFGVSYVGSLWAMDKGLSRARKISLSASVARACGISAGRELCVKGEDTDWRIDLAPDQRSGHVSATPLCARPEGAAAGSGRSIGR